MADLELVRILLQGARVWNAFVAKQRRDVSDWRARLAGVEIADNEFGEEDYGDSDVSGTDFYGRTSLHGVDLSGADLRNAVLSGADLRDADFNSADLTDADLSDTVLFRVSLNQANLNGANLNNARLTRADLTGADLTGAELLGSDLSHSILRAAKLSRAKMFRATLTGACLTEADLREADVRAADFTEADLTKANLSHANLFNAIVRRAKLLHANLTDTTFTNMNSSGVFARGSYLHLATCKGLETADFGAPDWLQDYLRNAFEFAHRTDTRDAKLWPDLIQDAIQMIRDLHPIQLAKHDSPLLAQAIDALTVHVIDYLKRHPRELYEIDPRTFEQLVGEVLASFGWNVDLTPKSNDGGYDIFALSPNGPANTESAWIIECKRYAPDRPVGVDVVRALYGSNLLHATVDPKATAGMKMLATTSHFTKGAQAFKASRYDLALRDYEGILEWLNYYRPNPSGRLWLDSQHQLRIGDEE